MEIILVRHGNSEANAGITTDLNSKLTSLGKMQAKATANFLSDYIKDIHNWRIISSPYKRAAATALKISERCLIDLEYDFDLREIIQEQGHYKPSDFPFIVSSRNDYKIDRMETDDELMQRMKLFRYADKIIIVSHGLPIQVLKDIIVNANIKKLPEWDKSYKNCSITHIKDGKLLLDRYVKHLEEKVFVYERFRNRYFLRFSRQLL